MISKNLLFIILFSISSLLSFSTEAHTRSQSFSQWQIEDKKVSINFNILTREVTRLAADASIDVSKDLDQILMEHLSDKITATVDGNSCSIKQALYSLPANEGYTRLEAELSCPEGNVLGIEIQGFFDVVPSHLHYARVIKASGEANEIVLSDAVRKQTVLLNEHEKNYWNTAKTYINLGVEHILMGTDHLVFLLVLLLLCHRISHALILITGFTLGHSITLSLSVLGWFQPSMITIEALIGFSIVLVALEKVQAQLSKSLVFHAVISMGVLIALKLFLDIGLPILSLIGITLIAVSYLRLVYKSDDNTNSHSTQFLLTTSFGFIHGFGFAEVLREIGLPPAELGLALFSFNIGVELGQMFSLLIMGLIGYILNRYFTEQLRQMVTVTVVSLVLGIGSYWFVFRSLNSF